MNTLTAPEVHPIGFIGLGRMGAAMAQNLLRQRVAMRVFNRTAAKAEPLVAAGAASAKTPEDAVTTGGVVITMLADDAAVQEAAFGPGGFGPRLGKGGVHVSMSTIAPTTAQRLADLHANHGSIYLAAPVFGRPDAAAAANLRICLSGNAAAKKRVHPLLNHLGQAVLDFGDSPTAAHVVKLCGNFMIAAAVEAMAEAFTLLEKAGVNKPAAASFLCDQLFASPIYRNYGRLIADVHHNDVLFELILGLKDLRLVRQTADTMHTPMPLASLAFDRLQSAVAKGRGGLDWTGLALGARDDAGLPS
ncbi:MAG: NAD(P)-dependent oxidoreductase [Phycisphaerales bacterium]|nr:NAD(P)-dependent oxidoreductase [Phycisphaerales bacterium]